MQTTYGSNQGSFPWKAIDLGQRLTIGTLKTGLHIVCLSADGLLRSFAFLAAQIRPFASKVRAALESRLRATHPAALMARRLVRLARAIGRSLVRLSVQARPHLLAAGSLAQSALKSLLALGVSLLEKLRRLPVTIQQIRHPDDPSETEFGASSTPNERLVRSLADQAYTTRLAAAQWFKDLPAKTAKHSRSALAQVRRCEPTLTRSAAKCRAGLKAYPQLDSFLNRSSEVLAPRLASLWQGTKSFAKASPPHLSRASTQISEAGDRIVSRLAKSPLGSMAVLATASLCLLLTVSKSSDVFASNGSADESRYVMALDREIPMEDSATWAEADLVDLVAIDTRPSALASVSKEPQEQRQVGSQRDAVFHQERSASPVSLAMASSDEVRSARETRTTVRRVSAVRRSPLSRR